MTFDEIKNLTPRLPFVLSLLPPESFICKGACRGLLEHEARDYVKYLETALNRFNSEERKRA